MLFDYSRNISCRPKLPKQRKMSGNLLTGKMTRFVGVKANHFFFITNCLIEIDQLSETVSAVMNSMKMFCITIQFCSACNGSLQLLFILCSVLRLPDSQCLLQLRQNLLLIRLIRVQFQAEVTDPKGGQTLLYNGKCRHLLRNEQYFLPLCHEIGNHAGNRL